VKILIFLSYFELSNNLSTINTNFDDDDGKTKKLGGALESLLQKHNSSATRKENNAALVAEGIDQLAIQKRVQQITSVTSGKMTSANIFCISNEHVRDRLQDDEDDKLRKTTAVQGRKHQQLTKQAEKFQIAATKYFMGNNLLCDDLKTLLKEISIKDDSPLKKKAEDLRIQFDHRKERMQKYNIMGIQPPQQIQQPTIPHPPSGLIQPENLLSAHVVNHPPTVDAAAANTASISLLADTCSLLDTHSIDSTTFRTFIDSRNLFDDFTAVDAPTPSLSQ
jgi:hypothetical protein